MVCDFKECHVLEKERERVKAKNFKDKSWVPLQSVDVSYCSRIKLGAH